MKKIASLLLALILLLSLAACAGKTAQARPEPASEPETSGGPADAQEPEEPAEEQQPEEQTPEEPEEEPAPETVTVTDDCGRTVEIPGEITRIVPTGGLAQIALFALVPDLFVGLANEWSETAGPYIDSAYLDLPVLGTLYGSADLNLEELAVTDPQLIIDLGEAKKTIVEDMDNMQDQTSIPSIHIEGTLATMADAYRKLGVILGREERAEELAAFCEKVYARTADIAEKAGDGKVSALYIVGSEGLNVIASGSFHAEVVDMLTDNAAVVDNPAGKGTGNEVTMEQIALWDPEFILFGPESIYEDAAERETWKDLKAIASGNYVEIPYGPDNWMGLPPSVQRYLGMIWLASVLYPDLCDYDVKTEITEAYRLFYGCELSDGQYAELTKNAFPAG